MVPLKIELPKDFLDEEVRCGYTVTKQMKEIWAVELDLAAQLLNVCERNNIKVFADAGTLLGAARHGGFIPWDDDMDFCMMRSEYEKLCSIASQEFCAPYFFQTANTDVGYSRGHAQLRNSLTTGILKSELGKVSFNQGIFIDIFPLDEVYDDDKKFAEQKRKVEKLQRIFRILNSYKYNGKRSNVFKECTVNLVDKIYPCEKWYERYEQELQDANGKNNDFVTYLCLQMNNKEWLCKRESYDNVSSLPFEHLQFPVPAGYGDVLTGLYGNWHKLVPGTSLHRGVYFDTENSYQKYLCGELQSED